MEHTNLYLGRQIGNYRIEKEIASGGFGTVFLARHVHLQHRTAVIKLLHAIRLNSDEERAQFLQEAQILDQLRGLPHILPMLDFGIEPGGRMPYMIADYAEKGSLRERMKQQHGPFPLPAALSILAQVAQGLQAAHDRQIVHRDLKPENVLFDARDQALLADFGISTVLTTASVKHTEVVGSPSYMAPEQFRGMVSKESDQYALACILYEMLTGARLFEATDFLAMGFMHVSTPPPSPRARNPHIPPHIELAMLKALAKERHERFPSVGSFIEALQQPSPHYTVTQHATPYVPFNAPPSHSFSEPQVPFMTPSPPPPPVSGGDSRPHSGWSQIPTATTEPRITPYGVITDPYVPPPSYRGQPRPLSYDDRDAMNPYASSDPYTPRMSATGQISYGTARPDLFLVISGSTRLLAALNYLLSPFMLFVSVPLYVSGRGNRFARFHLMQGSLFWLHIPVFLAFFYVAMGGSTPSSQMNGIQSAFACLCGLWLLMVVMLVIILCVAALGGKYFKIPLLARFSDTYAERGHRYKPPR